MNLFESILNESFSDKELELLKNIKDPKIEKEIRDIMNGGGYRKNIEALVNYIKKNCLQNYDAKQIENIIEPVLAKYSNDDIQAFSKVLSLKNEFWQKLLNISNACEVMDLSSMSYDGEKTIEICNGLYDAKPLAYGRDATGKGELLFAILAGAKIIDGTDIELRSGEHIEIKATNGRLDSSTSKALSLNYNDFKEIFESLALKYKFDYKDIYSTPIPFAEETPVNPTLMPQKRKITIPGVQPRDATVAPKTPAKYTFRDKKSANSCPLDLGKRNIEKNWPILIDFLDNKNVDKQAFISDYIEEIFERRFPNYRKTARAIGNYIKAILSKLANNLINGNSLEAIGNLSALELVMLSRSATTDRLDPKFKYLVLIGATDKDVRLMAINVRGEMDDFGRAVTKKKVLVNKFGAHSQASNLGVKLSKTKR